MIKQKEKLVSPIVRFAPSPTGYLHLGNARMALLNHFLAKKLGGIYILRIDDTDQPRVKEEYIEGIKEDLRWLDIEWQFEFKQSERLDVYSNFMKKLLEDGKIYECYESAEELEYKKKIQSSLGKPPIYDRSMLKLTEAQRQDYIKNGKKPHYRFKMEHKEIAWSDLVKEDILFKGENISDPVVIREDGSFLYILTSVLDDIEKNITHIIRGEDHIVNTAVQIQMFNYLGAVLPVFAHLPLITNNKGEGFSKRDGALSLRGLREKGIHPLAISNYLFALGLGEQNRVFSSNKEIAEIFDLSKYNSAAAQFDEAKLLKFNLHILQSLSFSEIGALVKKILNLDIDISFWEAVKDNIVEFKDIKTWFNIFHDDNLKTISLNDDLIRIAINTIPYEPFNDNTWNIWLEEIKAKSNLKGKDLYKPLRLAFSGMENGPEFKHIIKMITKERLIKRLNMLLNKI